MLPSQTVPTRRPVLASLRSARRNRLGSSVGSLLVWGVGLLTALGSASATAAVGWVDSLSEGVRQAQATGKPLFVVFRCVR